MAAKTALKPCTCSTVVAFDNETDEVYTTGCTATTRRTFAPGHDARLKGFLIRAGIADQLVRIGDDVNTSPEAIADQFGFSYMVATGIKNGKEKAAKKEFAALIRDTKRQAKATHKTPKQVAAKVGRWTYEGVVTDSPMHGPQFTYTNRKGIQTTTTKFTRV